MPGIMAGRKESLEWAVIAQRAPTGRLSSWRLHPFSLDHSSPADAIPDIRVKIVLSVAEKDC